jgi:F-type H+-transporting ATPase subunit beta
VRGIALTPTQGLARGSAVKDTGGPLKASVGKGILGRMFDVFGNSIDRQPPPSGVHWRTVHRDPRPLARRSTRSEMFETGIKVIDVLVPLERGGKAGLFGGAALPIFSLAAQARGWFAMRLAQSWPSGRKSANSFAANWVVLFDVIAT